MLRYHYLSGAWGRVVLAVLVAGSLLAEPLAPAADATLDFYANPAFSWQPVIGAATYCFQIATSDVGFSSACTVGGNQTVAKSTLATTHQPIAKLPNGSYFWRVVPLDPGGHNGT